MASLPYPRSHKYPTHPPKGVQQSLLHRPSYPRPPMDAGMVAWVWQGCHTLLKGCSSLCCTNQVIHALLWVQWWLREYGRDAIPS
ncbi:hypothetical protein [Leyella stercorea]|uniref:hypothetical protein n=1 Tax=Leyella stercorea TaxID=363265 RepID=UPI00242B94DC|nr:hypothetical protein [Leyella stercorea]